MKIHCINELEIGKCLLEKVEIQRRIVVKRPKYDTVMADEAIFNEAAV